MCMLYKTKMTKDFLKSLKGKKNVTLYKVFDYDDCGVRSPYQGESVLVGKYMPSIDGANPTYILKNNAILQTEVYHCFMHKKDIFRKDSFGMNALKTTTSSSEPSFYAPITVKVEDIVAVGPAYNYTMDKTFDVSIMCVGVLSYKLCKKSDLKQK